MPTGRQVAIGLIAVTIAAVLFNPFAAIVDNTAGQQSVTADTTVNYNESENLEGYDVVGSTLTVEWYNSTSSSYETVPSSQYEFDNSSATISWESGSEVPDGADARVSYDYRSTEGATTTIVNLTPLFVGLLILGTLAARIQQVM